MVFVFCLIALLTPQTIKALNWPTLFFDDFNDGNYDGWTVESGNWSINNGNLFTSQTEVFNFSGELHAGSDWDNYRVELDVNNEQGVDEGIEFRRSGNNHYAFNLRHGTGPNGTPEIKLFKTINGVDTLLASTHSQSLLNNVWYHVKIEVLNENIKLWVNDTLRFNYTDAGTNLKKGQIGLQSWTGANGFIRLRFDNVSITDLNAPPPKTPLILIPGIGGSELKVTDATLWNAPDGHGGTFNRAYSQNEKVWVNEGEAGNPGNDDYFDVLRMKADGITSEANLGLTGNLYSGAYGGAINFFTQNGYTLNQDFFVFPYDWRKDIGLTKDLLDQKIQQIKNQTGAQKVDIVTHSMGGLVARNYIADAGKAQNVRKLFTLGTPYLGSVESLKNIRYGGCLTKLPLLSQLICLGISPSEIKDVIQNMISGYELAPSQTYFNFYNGQDNQHPYPYRTESGTLNYSQIKNLLTTLGANTSLFNPSETFHTIDSSLSSTNGVEVTNIVGSGQGTLGQIIEEKTTSLLGIQSIRRNVIKINGDNTVPLLSASFGSSGVFYTNQKHEDLPSNGPALNLVKNILSNNNQLPAGVSSQPYKFSGTGLSVHSPVNIHVYDANNNHTGSLPNGDFEANIPGSSYDTLDDVKFIFLPDSDIYTIKFEATGNGSFDFRIRKYADDENTETILYKEIPLTDSTKAETVFDTNSTGTPIIKVDENGDGIIDFNQNPFSILEGNANFDYTPPTISFDINPETIWPPNNKMVDVNIAGIAADENPYLVKILVDDEYHLVEPSVIIQNQTSINQVIKLEASRKGDDLDGRKYAVKILATDLAGNTSVSAYEVIVPHDQRNKK